MTVINLCKIIEGEASFWDEGKEPIIASGGDLVFIPKGYRYKRQYTKKNTTFVLVNIEMFHRSGEDFALFVEPQRYPQILKGVLLLKQRYLENIPVARFTDACNISISSFRSLFSPAIRNVPAEMP